MRRRLLILPVAALCLLAAFLGLRAGQVPTETEIIDRFAALYQRTAGAGAAATDCLARPHPAPEIRLVVTCAAPDGATAIFHAGPRGEPVTPPEGPDA